MELRDGLIFTGGVVTGVALDEGLRYGKSKYDEYVRDRDQRLAAMAGTAASAAVIAHDSKKTDEKTPDQKVDDSKAAAEETPKS